MKLTERSIRALNAAGSHQDILHDRTPSAGLRITQRGAKIWFFMYRSPTLREPNGQPKQRRAYLGFHPSGRRPNRQPDGRDLPPMTLEQFLRAFDVFRGELAQGTDPQDTGAVPAEVARWIEPDAIPEALRSLYPEGYREGTFAALVVDYFVHHATVQLKARTVSGYKQAAKSFTSVLGAQTPREISTKEVRPILSSVEKRAPQMVRSVKKVLSAIFEYGRSHWHLQDNPARGHRITVKKGKRDRWLTDEELMAAFATCDALSDRWASDVYRLILYSMCRPGEAAYAKAEDILVSNQERVWRIRGKNGKEFLVPLVGPIGEILLRRYEEVGGRGFLFWRSRGQGQSTYPQPLRRANVEFRRLSGLENVRPHDFRRTGRTHIPALGVAESVAEALLNHAKGGIEGTYNLYDYWAERKQALALWHEKLVQLERGVHQRAA